MVVVVYWYVEGGECVGDFGVEYVEFEDCDGEVCVCMWFEWLLVVFVLL